MEQQREIAALLRRATVADVAGIAATHRETWPGETLDEAHVAAVVGDAAHATWVATAGGTVVGYADGFATQAGDGALRWEVDLIAVHPAWRGRGLGARLVAAVTQAGRERGAAWARALIHVDNSPSQQTFARAGYVTDGRPYALYVSSQGERAETPEASAALRVATLRYRGLWLETGWTRSGFRAAQARRETERLDLVGAVLPLDRDDGIAAARAAGLTCEGRYEWWTRALDR